MQSQGESFGRRLVPCTDVVCSRLLGSLQCKSQHLPPKDPFNSREKGIKEKKKLSVIIVFFIKLLKTAALKLI